MTIDISSLFVGGGSLAIIGGVLGVVLNNVLEFLKGKDERKNTRADTAAHFEELAARWSERFEERNEELQEVLERLITAVDQVIPLLQSIAEPDHATTAAAAVIELRKANQHARRVV